MVAKDIRWIRLLDPENHNISWANHISHTNPGKRDKSDPSFKRQWSRLFHCAALVLSSGRPRTEIAEDLGVGLSSLTRWIGQYRGEEMPPEIRDDLQAELKRLRKENAVLRQERDILKKAAAFFAKEGSR